MARRGHAGNVGMTLAIQRAEHRDTQAIHGKLDEILHALGDLGTNSPGSMKRSLRRSRSAGAECEKTISLGIVSRQNLARSGAASQWVIRAIRLRIFTDLRLIGGRTL